MARIQLSFKQTNKEMKLYTRILAEEKGERSDFIKDCIRFYIKHEEKNKKVENI